MVERQKIKPEHHLLLYALTPFIIFQDRLWLPDSTLRWCLYRKDQDREKSYYWRRHYPLKVCASVSRLSFNLLKPYFSNSFLSLTRDLFLFSFYAQGMPFVDMAFLRSSQIRDGQLIYHRHKTGQRVTIHLEPCMLAIISQYQRKGSDYVFPLLCSDNPQKAYDEYLLMLNRYNHTLKTLAKKARVTSRLTSYTARHTWASIAFSSNVDLPVISKALGHTNTQTTMTYIKEINDSRLEEANRRIINMIWCTWKHLFTRNLCRSYTVCYLSDGAIFIHHYYFFLSSFRNGSRHFSLSTNL